MKEKLKTTKLLQQHLFKFWVGTWALVHFNVAVVSRHD